jgi:hypothetical protein
MLVASTAFDTFTASVPAIARTAASLYGRCSRVAGNHQGKIPELCRRMSVDQTLCQIRGWLVGIWMRCSKYVHTFDQ